MQPNVAIANRNCWVRIIVIEFNFARTLFHLSSFPLLLTRYYFNRSRLVKTQMKWLKEEEQVQFKRWLGAKCTKSSNSSTNDNALIAIYSNVRQLPFILRLSMCNVFYGSLVACALVHSARKRHKPNEFVADEGEKKTSPNLFIRAAWNCVSAPIDLVAKKPHKNSYWKGAELNWHQSGIPLFANLYDNSCLSSNKARVMAISAWMCANIKDCHTLSLRSIQSVAFT